MDGRFLSTFPHDERQDLIDLPCCVHGDRRLDPYAPHVYLTPSNRDSLLLGVPSHFRHLELSVNLYDKTP